MGVTSYLKDNSLTIITAVTLWLMVGIVHDGVHRIYIPFSKFTEVGVVQSGSLMGLVLLIGIPILVIVSRKES